MSRPLAFGRNQFRQLALAHSLEALRDRRGMVTMLLIFGGMTIGLSVLDLLVAANTKSRLPGALMGAGVLASSLPLIALIGFTSLGLTSTAVPLAKYRSNGTLRQLGTTAVSRTLFIAAHLPIRLALGFIQIVILLALAVLFTPTTLATLSRASTLLVAAMLLLLALGYLIGARFQNPERTMNFSYILILVLIATSGTALPHSAFPDAVGATLSWLPTTLLTEQLASELLGTSPAPIPLWLTTILLFSLAAGTFALACKLFQWSDSDA
ncbi:ABC transporter permease [Leucobacter sp. wl10]|uniref:ABC transporter permease n=1 Tax=Leucobacter sp. wl10 TaxID=2304677 RepID=UPI000E5B0662|nr:ABC transporter permease [Leucobacter sp. wl10]RGE21583.1 ABC transporter permease [Leucobacter sp. wl10]